MWSSLVKSLWASLNPFTSFGVKPRAEFLREKFLHYDTNGDGVLDDMEVAAIIGRIIALHCRSATLYQIY
jgi:hypothetical protein